MLLRLIKKKKKGCQTSRNVCGIILLFLHKCGLRGGVVFSGPLPEGWALVGQVGRLLCLRDGKEGGKMEKEGGLNERKAFSKPFYPFILWVLHAHIHIQAQRASQTKSGCDIIHRKKCQTTFFFSLLCCVRCWVKSGASRSVSGSQRRRGSRGARGGHGSWICPPRGVSSQGVKHLNPPWTSHDVPLHSRPAAAGFQPGTVQTVFFPFCNLFFLPPTPFL